MDKTTLKFKLLNEQLERIHSTLVVITAALMGDFGWFEPAQMVPALKELTDKTYELVEETDRFAGGEQEENRT